MDPTTEFPFIRDFFLFTDIVDSDLKSFLAACSVEELPQGAVLFRPDQPLEDVYIVLSGLVGLFSQQGNAESLVDFFGPGQAVALASALFCLRNRLSARSIKGGTVLRWPVKSLRTAVKRNRGLAIWVQAMLCLQWQDLIDQIVALKRFSADERLLAFLLSLASEHDSGPATVYLPATRSLIAAKLGVTLATLSRAFADLRPLGVNGRGRSVTINDLSALRDAIARAGCHHGMQHEQEIRPSR